MTHTTITARSARADDGALLARVTQVRRAHDAERRRLMLEEPERAARALRERAGALLEAIAEERAR